MPPSVRRSIKHGNQAVAIPDLLKPFIGPDPEFPIRIRWARDHPGISNIFNATVEAFKRYCNPSDSLSEMVGAVWSFAERKWVPFTVEAFSPPLPPPIVLTPASAHTRQPETETHERRMVEDDYALQLGRSLARQTIFKAGVRYFPLSLAAPLAQAPETTIRDWIKKKNKFAGKTIQTHTSPTNGLYVSEEAVNRMGHRFITWPSQKPAGSVIIGETDDQSGYIGLTDAARTIGVERHTIWRWTTKGTAPTDKPLDVIKCTASDQFYISEKDVSDLKNLVPRAGLRRGPRPQLAL